MKILVPVKRVVDPNVKIAVHPDGTGVDIRMLKMSMNPFDEIALEAAIRLKEAGVADEVTVLSIGTAACQETLRHALALGADNALLIETDELLSSLNIAKICHHVVTHHTPAMNVVLMGKQSIDGDNNQVPQMLAGLLGWSQATYASDIKPLENGLQVTREIDQGAQTVFITLPAVVSVDLRLNVPRYASLPNIMQAKRKPLTVTPLTSLGIALAHHRTVVSVRAPLSRGGGVIVDSVESLVDKLRHEVNVI